MYTMVVTCMQSLFIHHHHIHSNSTSCRWVSNKNRNQWVRSAPDWFPLQIKSLIIQLNQKAKELVIRHMWTFWEPQKVINVMGRQPNEWTDNDLIFHLRFGIWIQYWAVDGISVVTNDQNDFSSSRKWDIL